MTPIPLTVDLNADLAEDMTIDRQLLEKVTSANVACGAHAGDAVHMQNAVRWAKANGVRIGAHPSFPDRENFGRTAMEVPSENLRAHLRYQLGALQALCRAENVPLEYVKPHGALYNQAAKDAALAALIAEEVKAFDPALKLMGLSGSCLISEAQKIKLDTISEVFADRRYQADGSLVPRSRPNAQVESDAEAIAQVLQMVQQGTVTAVSGEHVPVSADSICLHGDGQHALDFAEKIRAALAAEKITVRA